MPIRAGLVKRDEREASTIVIALNKPFDVLSQFTQDHPGQRTLAEFDLPKDIYAAGRLDRDSEGLLLLTNDGPLIKRLLDPENGHKRSYLVKVEGEITAAAIQQLQYGVKIGDYQTRSAQAEKIEPPSIPERNPPVRFRKSIPTSWIRLTLTEGKNRQVRRMTASIGYPTLRLIRESIGALRLGELQPGEYRVLSVEEVKKLKLDL